MFYTEPATHSLTSTEDTYASKNPAQAARNSAQDSLSQEIARSFDQEFLETDPNTQALSSFLAVKLIDEYSANENITNKIDKSTIDKISLHSSQPEENFKINKDQLKHLSKEESNAVIKIIEKYKSFWSNSKYSIGKFKGFKAD